jgi:hypothetical protein
MNGDNSLEGSQGFVSCNYISPFEDRGFKDEINRRKYHWIALDPKLLILRSKLTLHLINIVGSFIPNFKEAFMELEYKGEPEHPFEDMLTTSENSLFRESWSPFATVASDKRPDGVIIERSFWDNLNSR